MIIGQLAAVFVGGFAAGWMAHKKIEAPRMVRRALDGVQPREVIRERTVVRDRIVRVPIETIRYIEVPHLVFVGGEPSERERVTQAVQMPEPIQTESATPARVIPAGRSRRLIG
jgi:hypothetical protein